MGVDAIRFREFVGNRCPRCEELFADHSIRPVAIPELPDVAAGELICPMLVLDLSAGSSTPHVYGSEGR